MKFKLLLSGTLMAAMIGISPSANAGFSGPFDFWEDDDSYSRFGPGNRGYGRDRWNRYDEWEPNYWRYRYFEDDSDDYIFDEFDDFGDFGDFDGFDDFDGDFLGDGRFDFNMNMDMDVEGDSDFESDYNNDYRRGARRYRRDYDRPAARNYERPAPARRAYDRPNRSDYERYKAYKADKYRRSGQRRMSDTPEQQRRRDVRRSNKPVECR